jgi:phosphoglycolate phosphatase-like HAD superfamily hydrolase
MAKHAVPDSRTAAVGDTVFDLPMLQAAALPFFVGTRTPDGAGGLIHIPGADLRVITDRVLAVWAVRESALRIGADNP